MRRRRSQSSIVANPVLVGAVTTLVVVVAVFLAYNANNGLPFVPTTDLRVQMSNGANLVVGNEVRSGGYRVGVVERMDPVKLPNGKVGAEIVLKLDRSLGRVPVDSRVTIRPRSALGLKYVELEEGRSKELMEDGATLPLQQTRIPVEIDEVFNMFDKETRDNNRTNLVGFGNALAGRGDDLNRTIQSFPGLFGRLESVMRNLADPRTDLESFFQELGDAARVVAPVSDLQARLFTDMANTFEAFSRDPEALKATISKSPPTMDVAIESFKVQTPFLNRFADFSENLEAATEDLPETVPPLTRALRVGTPVQRRSVELNEELEGALGALAELTEAPTTMGALRGLEATIGTLNPTLKYVGPYVTVCNYWNTFWTFTAEHFTAPESSGGAERALLNNAASQDDGIGTTTANEFAHGRNVRPNNGGRPQYVHNNTFGGRAINPDGTALCQPGQQGYLYAANPHNPYDDEDLDRVAVEPVVGIPGGPTYDVYDREGNGSGANRPRVPEGQTFSDTPLGRGIKLPAYDVRAGK